MPLDFDQKQLSFLANWEASSREHDSLYRVILAIHLLSAGVLIILYLAPLSAKLRYAITIPMFLLNMVLYFYFRGESKRQTQYLNDSMERYVQKESDRPS